VRSHTGMQLTDAGRAVLPYAERVLRAAQDLRQTAQAFRSGRVGRLDIGSSPSVGTYLLPDVLKRFRQLHPNVDLAVRTGHSEEILRAVVDGEVQIGLVRDVHIDHPEVTAVTLYEDEIVLTAHPDHPFARRGPVSIEEVGREGVILFDRASTFYEVTQSLFNTAGVQPRIIMELDSVEGAKMMVLHGLGVALLPLMAVEDALASGVLVRVAIHEAPRVFRHILAVRRSDRPFGELQNAFLALFERARAGAGA
jgi:DNA-binding transcriptional LysR family regulator